jgi:hypothetical protein
VIVTDRGRIHDNLLIHPLFIRRLVHVNTCGINNVSWVSQLDHWAQAQVGIGILNAHLRRVSSSTLVHVAQI